MSCFAAHGVLVTACHMQAISHQIVIDMICA
jgi:hypothetical protein